MCGIFGITLKTLNNVSDQDIKDTIEKLFIASETRGKESSGIAIRIPGSVTSYKRATRASKFIRSAEYNRIIDSSLASLRESPQDESSYLTIIGHARLVTNGLAGIQQNNQPVEYNGIVGVHNGIIVNAEELWTKHPEVQRRREVDTEVIMALMRNELDKGVSVEQAISSVFNEIYGAASVAMLAQELQALILASNFGSLYVYKAESNNIVAFASQRNFLESTFNHTHKASWGPGTIRQVAAGTACIVDNTTLETHHFTHTKPEKLPALNIPRLKQQDRMLDLARLTDERRSTLQRCSRCILPETFPFIHFDEDGVCNYCHEYRPINPQGHDALMEMLEPHRKSNGEPDCIVPFSGGRDSSYALHYIKRELGMNPVAYTYDWALVTDLARRNQARLCDKLNVEHYLYSADIKQKRKYIRHNIHAWLKKPELGMIPLFMAGDKFYFYYAQQVRKTTGIDLVLFGGNKLEKTNFKSGFCGIPDEGGWRVYDVPIARKAKLMLYYVKQFATNPRYFNSSIGDTAISFYISYFMKHDFQWFYNYIPWEQETITETLKQEYDWETASDTDNTWRIGDGTAAFYNYIYYTVAGFSEHDTFLSNQIREGTLTREKALVASVIDNQPRFESIFEYANTIGFDFDYALSTIESIPKLY